VTINPAPPWDREKLYYKEYHISGYTARGFDHGLTLATNHHCNFYGKPSQISHSCTCT